MRSLVVVMLAACGSRSGSPGDLSSPAAAARCEVAAIHARSTSMWMACMHPAIRDRAEQEVERTIRKGKDFWPDMAAKAARLETVTDADFETKPMPAGKAELGDKVASFRLAHDSLAVVHYSDGNWYIVDTGL